MIVPEIRLKIYLESIIMMIRQNYKSAQSPSETLLYSMFHDEFLNKMSVDGKYDFYVQAVDLFVKKASGNADAIAVNTMFNGERANMPTIHITMPNEESVDGVIGDNGEVDNTDRGLLYTHNFRTDWDFIITGKSSYEVLTIYRVIQMMMASTKDSLTLLGFYNPTFHGGELHIASEAVPQGIVARSIRLTASYTSVIKSFAVMADKLRELIITGIINNNNGSNPMPPIKID